MLYYSHNVEANQFDDDYLRFKDFEFTDDHPSKENTSFETIDNEEEIKLNDTEKTEMESAGLNHETANKVTIACNAFIPNILNAPWYEDNKAWIWEPGLSSKLFSSDNRGYEEHGTSRISHKSTFSMNPMGEIISKKSSVVVGASEQSTPIRKKVWVPPHPTKDHIGGNYREGQVTGLREIEKRTAANKGDNSFKKIEENKGENEYEFIMRGEASYPFSSLAPDIDFNISFLVGTYRIGNSIYLIVAIVGQHDNFPAYEVIITVGNKNTCIYTDKVGKNDGPGLVNLNTSKIFSSEVLSLNVTK